MNREEIVAVVLRLFALAIAIRLLRDIPGLVVYAYQGNLGIQVFSFAGLVVFVMTGFALWRFSSEMARWVLPTSSASAQQGFERWSPDALQQVGFTILGMYLLYRGISSLSYWLFFLYDARSHPEGPLHLNFGNWASIYTAGIEIAFSLWLILGASGIVGMIRRFREAGLRKRVDEQKL